MPRAGTICFVAGCPEMAIGDGRCGAHQRDHGWDSSTRRKPIGWAKIRRRILRRDHFRCRVCGSRSQLVVDHLKAQSFGGGEQFNNLRALCTPCHKAKTLEEARLGRAVTRMSADERKAEIAALVYRWS